MVVKLLRKLETLRQNNGPRHEPASLLETIMDVPAPRKVASDPYRF